MDWKDRRPNQKIITQQVFIFGYIIIYRQQQQAGRYQPLVQLSVSERDRLAETANSQPPARAQSEDSVQYRYSHKNIKFFALTLWIQYLCRIRLHLFGAHTWICDDDPLGNPEHRTTTTIHSQTWWRAKVYLATLCRVATGAVDIGGWRCSREIRSVTSTTDDYCRSAFSSTGLAHIKGSVSRRSRPLDAWMSSCWVVSCCEFNNGQETTDGEILSVILQNQW